jgi:very-short-patch-repair endonuclease
MQSGRYEARNVPSGGIDAAIARLALRQHGVIGRSQLIDLGASRGAIRHRLNAGRLHRVHPTVYVVGIPQLTRHGRYLAAVLACGDGAVLSHGSAAALWGLLEEGRGLTEVTIPRLGPRSIEGIRVRRSRRLDAEEIGTCDGIPVTTPARTLVDEAGIVSARRLRRAVEQSLVLKVFDLRAVNRALERARGVRGTGTLRRLVHEVAWEPPFTRSELERRFLELVRRAHLPLPVVNGLVLTYEVDFHWPQARLVVEADSRAFHGHALAFHHDRQRDLELESAGWHVLRITWRQVLDEPERVVRLLRSRLA